MPQITSIGFWLEPASMISNEVKPSRRRRKPMPERLPLGMSPMKSLALSRRGLTTSSSLIAAGIDNMLRLKVGSDLLLPLPCPLPSSFHPSFPVLALFPSWLSLASSYSRRQRLCCRARLGPTRHCQTSVWSRGSRLSLAPRACGAGSYTNGFTALWTVPGSCATSCRSSWTTSVSPVLPGACSWPGLSGPAYGPPSAAPADSASTSSTMSAQASKPTARRSAAGPAPSQRFCRPST